MLGLFSSLHIVRRVCEINKKCVMKKKRVDEINKVLHNLVSVLLTNKTIYQRAARAAKSKRSLKINSR